MVHTEAVTGGGTLPGVTIPSAGVAIDGDVTARLRGWSPPIIARVIGAETVIDLRTVLPEQDDVLKAFLCA